MDLICLKGRSLGHSEQPNIKKKTKESTANHLPSEDGSDIPIAGKDGVNYVRQGAFTLETQKYPDAMNHCDFPSVVLNPGQLYDHQVVYRFGSCPKRV